jgi:acetyl-CoA decarbonylase/synthase complex subunit gamma
VAAHQVAQRCGFTVGYAAIRAADLPEYLDNGLVTTPAMQEMTFSLYERLVLVPVEVVLAMKSLLAAAGVVLLTCGLSGGIPAGFMAFSSYVGAALAGMVIGPLLLPWLPGRSFAVKGAAVGLAWTACFRMLTAGAGWSWPATIAALLALPAVSAFYTLNFTGCTTYTSRSGVKKEMRLGLPVMGGAVVLGVMLLLLGRFI